MSGPAPGRHKRANALRALSACLALIAASPTLAQAQTLTPDLFRPGRDGFVLAQELPLRLTGSSTDAVNDARLRREIDGSRSRIGQIPTYGVPAASGASVSGFNSLNRTRNKLKLYPGQAKPKPPPGPGSPPPAISTGRLSSPPSASAHSAPVQRRWPARCRASRHASA